MVRNMGDWRYLPKEPPLEPPEPEVVAKCSWCGEDICDGDGFYELPNDELVCDSCMEDVHKVADITELVDPWEDLRVEEAIEKWKGIDP